MTLEIPARKRERASKSAEGEKPKERRGEGKRWKGVKGARASARARESEAGTRRLFPVAWKKSEGAGLLDLASRPRRRRDTPTEAHRSPPKPRASHARTPARARHGKSMRVRVMGRSNTCLRVMGRSNACLRVMGRLHECV